ncbi:4628_t:CDS:1, partial [Scutellospora calospora]
MKSECTKALTFKIPTLSSLPKFNSPKPSSSCSSPKTPTSPFVLSSTKMPVHTVHSKTSSMSAIFISSRPNTPSSSIKSSSIPSSPITPPARIPAQLKTQNLPTSSSIPNMPTAIRSPTSSVNSLSNPAIQQSLRMSRSRTPSLTSLTSSYNYDSSIPNPLGAQSHNGISSIPSIHSNIPSGFAPKSNGTDSVLMQGRIRRYSQNYTNLTQSTPSQAIK